MKMKLGVILLLFISTLNIQATATEANGIGYQNNAIKPTVLNTTGESSFSGTNDARVKWIFETDEAEGGTEMSSPIIGVDGSVYVISGGDDRKLYSVNSAGTKEWSKPLLFNGDANYLFPVLNSAGNLYIKTLNAYEYRLDGLKRAVSDIGTPYWGSMAVGKGGTAYLGGSGVVHAFDADLKEKWTYTDYGDNKTPVLGNDGTLYVLSGSGRQEQLTALDANGKLKWAYKLAHDVSNSIPVVSKDGTIYVTARGAIYAIDPVGKLKWKKELPNTVGNSVPSVDEDGVIYFAYDNQLMALNSDGTEKWKFDSKYAINANQISRTVIDKNGVAYFTAGDTENGVLYAVSDKGAKKWQMNLAGVAGNTPAINADGTIYVSTSQGKLYAIGAPDKQEKVLKGILPSSQEMALKKGEKGILKAAAVFDNLSRKNVTDLSSWESSDLSVVSISGKGVLMAGKEGTASVKVKYKGFEQVIKVTVKGMLADSSDPYYGKDKVLLDDQTDEALAYLNEMRRNLGLVEFRHDEKLRKAAQSHSNYKLQNGDGFSGAHYQEADGLGFTGHDPTERANYFGYEGSVDEGIARLTVAKGAAEGLLNAPYHRMSIVDPNYQDIGIGYNHLGVSVLNYATKGSFDNGTAVAYPYDGQTDVSPIWFDDESPSPLSLFDKRRTYSGFPISLSVHDQATAKLMIEEVHLWDSDKQEVEFYLIDNRNDPSNSQKSMFIIPKEKLKPGSTYHVSVKANKIDTQGNEEPLKKEWSFKTQAALKIKEMYFNSHQNGSSNLTLANAISLETSPTNLPDINWVLKDTNGEMVYSVEGSSTNRTIHYDQSSRKNMTEFLDTLTPGKYVLEVGTSLFSKDEAYEVVLNGDRQFEIGRLLQNSIVSPANVTFDWFTRSKANFSLSLNGNKLLSVTDDETQLVEGKDYLLVNDTVELKEEYLNKKPLGEFKLVFKFNAGSPQTVKVTVTDTTPVDTVPPGSPRIDKVTDASTKVTGTAEAGSTINVQADAKSLGKATTDVAGKFAVEIEKQKAGTKLSITATDKAGNISDAVSITVKDGTPPATPAVNKLTEKSTEISGLAEVGSTILVKVGTSELVKGKASLEGKFFLSIEPQVAGTVLTVVAIDGSGNQSAETKVTVEKSTPAPANRISGTDRYTTAIAISKEGWKTADTVVLATAGDFPDALAGGPLAYQENAPILLTRTKALNVETKEEIERLGAKKVIILGSKGAVSAEVETELKKMGLVTERLGGKTRFETAALIAGKMDSDQAIVANGLNFPDVLSVSSYAAKNGVPILLTRTDRLPDETKSALDGISSTYVIGSTGVVSKSVSDSLPKPTRFGGKDRYETGYEVATKLKLGTDKAYIATGSNFPDALAGSVLAAKNNAPILLVRPQQIPEATNKQLATYDGFSIFGGTGAVSEDVKKSLDDALKN
ncbi:hypothetical protein BBI11_13035 [Planococcus maritimus]|uniref:cell wall-binding repeat-containing protein n=1 Tax=Planococcus maritimus TaxID=192421 RepID=UPI00080F28DD|nr:cell wall-binding repeat-containing protein [Planococcus maritimus]ANU17899.1 hypothetical protein BBI11_13035 [Planococcus maritimus]